MNNRLYVIVTILLVVILAGCAQSLVVKSMTPTPEQMSVKTVGDQEVISCNYDNHLVQYSKKAQAIDSPFCDDSIGELQISTTDGLLKLSVVVLTDTPSVNHVSVSYHFRLLTKDNPNEKFFTDCSVQVGDNESVPMIGLSAFSFIVEEDANVSIVCTLDGIKVKAEFPVISEKVE